MGISTNIYLGPYVECTVRATFINKEAKVCTNKNCANNNYNFSYKVKGGNFCPICGAKIDTISVKVSIQRSPYDIVGDDLADITGASESIYLAPNKISGTPRRFSFDAGYDDHHEDLLMADSKAEIIWFEKEYAESLKLIRENYDNVKIKWGIHIYFT